MISIILPVHNQANHIRKVVTEYAAALEQFKPYELILVPNGCRDNSEAVSLSLQQEFSSVRVVSKTMGGWGLAVNAGLKEARGTLLCYTNSARTEANELVVVLTYALANPDAVIKANRKIRESFHRRLGSLLYNLECRFLFDLSQWDINGTPKIFPRKFARLLELNRNDDLIDLEFCLVCKQEGYPLLEVPILPGRRHGGESTTGYRSAIRLYWGAYRMHRPAKELK